MSLLERSLNCTCVPLLSQSSSILEMMGFILLSEHSCKLNVICVYRPPARDKIADFSIKLEVLLHSIRSSNNILCGDLNIDLFDLTAAGNQFVDMMRSFSYFSCISLPTRITATTSSLIDHFWCNALSISQTGIFSSDISDHYPIVLLYPFISIQKTISRTFRDHYINSLSTLSDQLYNFLTHFSSLTI